MVMKGKIQQLMTRITERSLGIWSNRLIESGEGVASGHVLSFVVIELPHKRYGVLNQPGLNGYGGTVLFDGSPGEVLV